MKKIITLAMAALMVLGFVSCSGNDLDMVKIPGTNFKMLKTEVTQELYESVMGENPSYFQLYKEDMTKGENVKKLPVENVSWYDAIYFCNKLSVKKGLKPVYAVDGETDVTKWNYTPHKEEKLEGKVTRDENTNGFRLPTKEEWEYAARGGQNYTYSGSDILDEVGWYQKNSNKKTHEVALKKPNGYGLYDMSGNVAEWCWDFRDGGYYRCNCGGSWYYGGSDCEVDGGYYRNAYYQRENLGFRIVRNAK